MVFLDHVHIDMFRKLRYGLVMGVVSSHICSVTLVEISRFVNRFVKD